MLIQFKSTIQLNFDRKLKAVAKFIKKMLTKAPLQVLFIKWLIYYISILFYVSVTRTGNLQPGFPRFCSMYTLFLMILICNNLL